MNLARESAKLREHYRDLLRKYGSEDARALNWANEDSQVLRFHVLMQIGNLNGMTVLDLGCGVGDFYPILLERFPEIHYIGMDLNPEFIAICRERYPEVDFHVGNMLEPLPELAYDYVLSSGTFGYAIEDYVPTYFEVMRSMYRAARKGVGLNLLNARHHEADPLYATFDPLAVHQFAMETTDKFILRQDYLYHDITLYLKREF